MIFHFAELLNDKIDETNISGNASKYRSVNHTEEPVLCRENPVVGMTPLCGLQGIHTTNNWGVQQQCLYVYLLKPDLPGTKKPNMTHLFNALHIHCRKKYVTRVNPSHRYKIFVLPRWLSG